MKLELEHLAPYLAYGLKMYWESLKGQPYEPWILDYSNVGFALNNQNKPILRPLSDLTKEIEMNGIKFTPINVFSKSDQSNILDLLDDIENDESMTIDLLAYYIVQHLFECHFDIFGLIENNLAININELFKLKR